MANRRAAPTGPGLPPPDTGPGAFDGGPPLGLQRHIGLVKPGRPFVARRAALTIAATWLPLAAITGAQTMLTGDASFRSFLGDYAVHARLLIAVPLLLAAEASCLPRLSAIAHRFGQPGLIAPEALPAYRRAFESTVRLRDSMRIEIMVLALAIALIALMLRNVPPPLYPGWHHSPAGARIGESVAGWWHDLVSVPILLMLLLGWVARLLLWTRFLVLVSRLDLKLVAAHPDAAGGLRFVGGSVPSFSLIAFALGTIVAGTIANRVVHDGAALLSFRYVLLGFVVIVGTLFVAPLLAFSGKLLETRRRGTLVYGALASEVGLEMERKWLGRSPDAGALDVNDFSATTDLYGVVSNVYGMNVVPMGAIHIGVLAAATLLPFAPLIFLVVPPDVIFQKLLGDLL